MQTLPSRISSLHALRGFAALVVVIYHWPLLLKEQITNRAFLPADQPFNSLLWPCYAHGFRAVELFFALSGFIFFWLYGEKVAGGAIQAREFFVRRFSRLYPLHFATLWFVLGIKGFLRWNYADNSMCNVNDNLPHFLLQLVFASNWYGESQWTGWTFNVPIWSVSVECLLYAMFFVICALRLQKMWVLLALAFGGCLLGSTGLDLVGRGMISFFLGGCAFHVLCFLQEKRIVIRPALAAGCLVGVWVLAILIMTYFPPYPFYRSVFGDRLLLRGHDVVGAVLLFVSGKLFELIVFPASILLLAIIEKTKEGFCEWFSFLGDLSYSLYLLHFPLLLVFYTVTKVTGIDGGLFYSPVAFLGYLAILFPLSWASYHYWESPMQTRLRKFFHAGAAQEPVAAPVR
ncbi:MAG: acyltransferase [Verrucomicrobiota bacterium]